MKLDIPWEDFEPFLKIRRQQSDLSIRGHKGRFQVLAEYFKDREFDADNFDKFVYYEIDKAGKSNSLFNNYLKLVKHLAAFLKISSEFADYHFKEDHTGHPENILTPEQITRLAECKVKYLRFKNRAPKIKALIYFLGHIGSRITETLSLEWNDLKLEEKTPLVHFRKEITKNNRERYVPCPRWIIKLLLGLPREGSLIFSKIEQTNLREDLKKRAIKCKIPFDITPHTFRDSSANNKLEVDIPLQEVTSLLGHSTPSTTYKYYVRIQAKKLASSLYQKDPAFQEDQTFDIYIQGQKEEVQKTLNPRVCDYTSSETIDNGKRTITMVFKEK